MFGGLKRRPDPVVAANTPPPLVKEAPPPELLEPPTQPPQAAQPETPPPKPGAPAEMRQRATDPAPAPPSRVETPKEPPPPRHRAAGVPRDDARIPQAGPDKGHGTRRPYQAVYTQTGKTGAGSAPGRSGTPEAFRNRDSAQGTRAGNRAGKEPGAGQTTQSQQQRMECRAGRNGRVHGDVQHRRRGDRCACAVRVARECFDPVDDAAQLLRPEVILKSREEAPMDATQSVGRFTGTLLGFAVGDALGMPAQFLTRDQIQRYYGKPISGFLKAHPGHASDFLNQGSYTDDTQMMLATAECLIECRKMDIGPPGGCAALLVHQHHPAPDTDTGECARLQAPRGRARLDQERRLQQRVRSRRADGRRSASFFLNQPDSLVRAATRRLQHHPQRTAGPRRFGRGRLPDSEAGAIRRQVLSRRSGARNRRSHRQHRSGHGRDASVGHPDRAPPARGSTVRDRHQFRRARSHSRPRCTASSNIRDSILRQCWPPSTPGTRRTRLRHSQAASSGHSPGSMRFRKVAG